MNQYIIPLPHNDPRLFSHVSQAFSLVDLGKRLLDAAKNGDVEEVKNLINNGAPFTTDWLGISALHFASMNGHLTSCEALLRAGISRDARTKVDRTPLHLAAQEGHADIVELLLRNGADLGAKDMLRMTALHWAAERGHTPVVQMLMRFGADAHLQNKFEMTPLDIAESKGHLDARDAMLNSQYDLISSVGRMAATNGDLVNANAYILTDEETLVPAAPPADEVTVTATTLEELPNSDDLKKLTDSMLNPVNGDTISSSNPDELNSEIDTNCKLLWPNDDLGKIPDSDPNSESQCGFEFSHSKDTITELTYNSKVVTDNENAVDSSKPPFSTEDNLLMSNDVGRDVMIVETLEGETLFVRQQSDIDGSDGLALFNSSGERVDNPALMAQVVDAMITLPDRGNSDSLEVESLPTGLENFDTSTLAQISGNLDNADQSLSKCSSTDQTESMEQVICDNSDDLIDSNPKENICTDSTKTTVANAPLIPSLSGEVQNDEEDGDLDDSESLVAQLAAFANHPDSSNASIFVEGMGAGASTHDLIMWCLYNGIFIRGYADEPTFSVEFVYQGDAYTLAASYDSQTGSIGFYHLGSEPKTAI